MATDRWFATLLRALQESKGDADTSRLVRSASSLLTSLNNPLNVTLLTTQILSASAIWQKPNGLHVPLQVLTAFASATFQHRTRKQIVSSPEFTMLRRKQWLKAVADGANDNLAKWKHLLVFCGLLLGMEKDGEDRRLRASRKYLDMAIVRVTNFILLQREEQNWWSAQVIPLSIGRVFSRLSEEAKHELRHELLLPLIIESTLYSDAALNCGYFLSAIDIDLRQVEGNKFHWAPDSSTYSQVRRLTTSPLVGMLGPLSQMAAYCMGCVERPDLLKTLAHELLTFAKSLDVQWRQNKLSEVDTREEEQVLAEETRTFTLPLLWRLLQSVDFFIVFLQKSLLENLLTKINMPQSEVHEIAAKTLHTLRCLHFVVSRMGHSSSSAYSFIYTTCIDVLVSSPVEIEALLREMQPAQLWKMAKHPQERCYDSYFLSLGEQFSMALPPLACEELLIAAAYPYLEGKNDIRLSEMCEAAHSTFLAVLVAPQCAQLTSKYLVNYLTMLFQAFPHTLAPQQLYKALRILAQSDITVSSSLGVQSPLSSIIMETLHERLNDELQKSETATMRQEIDGKTPVSRQSLLLLAMIDVLPFLNTNELQDWLPIILISIQFMRSFNDLESCRTRFWALLNDGEMDYERAAVCNKWWNTAGGRRGVVLIDQDWVDGKVPMQGAPMRLENL